MGDKSGVAAGPPVGPLVGPFGSVWWSTQIAHLTLCGVCGKSLMCMRRRVERGMYLRWRGVGEGRSICIRIGGRVHILYISQQRVSQHTYPIYTCRTQTRCDEREGEQRERREGRTQGTHQRGYTPYPTRSTSRDTPPRRPATGGGYAPRLALEVYPRGVRRGHPDGDIPLETRLQRYIPPETGPRDWSSDTGPRPAPRHRPPTRHRHCPPAPSPAPAPDNPPRTGPPPRLPPRPRRGTIPPYSTNPPVR